MIKKTILFILAIVLVGCSTRRSTVRTSKAFRNAPTSSIIKTTKSAERKSDLKKAGQGSSETEILEATSKVKVTTAIVLDYISKYKDVAKSNMSQYGIPASIILGQGILESGAGTGVLSSVANNHFGIKCHEEWTGASVRYDDDSAQECFRKYNQSNDSYMDHALFLTSRPWYAGLFKLKKDDYREWAKGLKSAGYATDPKYPEKLIAIIERYQLNKYDSEVLGTTYVPLNTNDYVSADSDMYQVSKGDTLYSISKRFAIPIEELRRKNAIQDNAISIGQNLKIK